MITARAWGLSPADEAQVMRALRFRYFKWDTYGGGRCLVLPEFMILSQQAHQEVVAAVEGLHRALDRFVRRVQGDSEALARLGIPAPLHPLIAAEQDGAPTLGRYDLFLTDDGRWMVSEFNDDVPGGFNEAAGLPALLGDPGDGLEWHAELRERFLDAFRDYDAVALFYATAYAEDLQHMLILERWLAEAGHRTVRASPAHLERGWRRPRVLGTPIDAAFRFYPGEWMPRLPNFATWLRLGPGIPQMNPLRHLARQSKTMFAIWRQSRLDPEDRALVERHCPITMPFDGQQVPLLRVERECWVLKRAFGRMGDAVVLGSLATEREWEETIALAQKAPADWCVQECFAVRAIPFAQGPMYPAVGAYVVNGRFAGYYSRAAARPLITHEAYHVATLVQAA
ncbi:MAG: hypothetical protein A3K13_04450 [Gemmatimonadetes bacterium RIFCSPLOWO2_12_FULL_68_9]|nr:MAG: hypothetical protein A3K13_04450 [Gemmatimonadetes bacterium RIFCSPLOWO2_12_FULL_68_9]